MSAPSGKLPLGWTGSDPVLLGHLPRNNRALCLHRNHLGLEADLGMLDQGEGKSDGRALLYRLAQSLEAAGEWGRQQGAFLSSSSLILTPSA